MKLTGKASYKFEKWYIPYLRKQRPDYDRVDDYRLMRKFYRMIPSMKFGVYIEFFDSVGIKINSLGWRSYGYEVFYSKTKTSSIKCFGYQSSLEAQSEVLKKACEVFKYKCID